MERHQHYPDSPEGLFSVGSDTHDSKLGEHTTEMKNNRNSGSADEKRLPGIGEVYRQHRPDMKAAETKEEAYEAIEPVVGLAGIYDQMPIFEELPVGGGILPDRIATVTPLSPKEVEDAIIEAGQEWTERASEESRSD